jgi:hypothetical protein
MPAAQEFRECQQACLICGSELTQQPEQTLFGFIH